MREFGGGDADDADDADDGGADGDMVLRGRWCGDGGGRMNLGAQIDRRWARPRHTQHETERSNDIRRHRDLSFTCNT